MKRLTLHGPRGLGTMLEQEEAGCLAPHLSSIAEEHEGQSQPCH